MFEIKKSTSVEGDYALMAQSAKSIIDGEKDVIANLANISAVINSYMDNIIWVGFYIFKSGELVLGPFQGRPACVRIKPGKGVCGTAFIEKGPVIVDDVEKFPGHIACDSNSRSEIVLPILKGNEVFGVLDIDS
ncbi:MAG: GAF domain-containing protein, partial [Clostridiales bacterium]|nr:GAF domain-containing protein [Clostridiales bacterium]